MPDKARRSPVKKQVADRSLNAQYNAQVKSGKIKDDSAQRAVLARLESLALGLASKPKTGGIARFFRVTQNEAALRGLYVWGGVGRGKSMLMDLFFEAAPPEKKRRVHFHAFMQEVHARIHHYRQNHVLSKSGADPVITLAQEISAETSLLCFDELQATDVTDATLLYRLFEYLFAHGVLVVSTSNHPPKSLYTGGVQAERFAKFISLIEEHMDVLALDSEQDYRYTHTADEHRSYFYPLGFAARNFVDTCIASMCKNPVPVNASLTVQGRQLKFVLYDGKIGRFTFLELCASALGAADYLAIAKKLSVLILTDIPKLPPEKRNEAKRFVTLIDALYENKVKLIATAETAPEGIYKDGDGTFEFARTVSRLIEMQSKRWTHHG